MKKSLVKVGILVLIVATVAFGGMSFAGDEAPGPKSIDPIEFSLTK